MTIVSTRMLTGLSAKTVGGRTLCFSDRDYLSGMARSSPLLWSVGLFVKNASRKMSELVRLFALVVAVRHSHGGYHLDVGLGTSTLFETCPVRSPACLRGTNSATAIRSDCAKMWNSWVPEAC